MAGPAEVTVLEELQHRDGGDEVDQRIEQRDVEELGPAHEKAEDGDRNKKFLKKKISFRKKSVVEGQDLYDDGYRGYEEARGDIELIAGDPAFKDEKQAVYIR